MYYTTVPSLLIEPTLYALTVRFNDIAATLVWIYLTVSTVPDGRNTGRNILLPVKERYLIVFGTCYIVEALVLTSLLRKYTNCTHVWEDKP